MTAPENWKIFPLKELVDVLDNLRIPVNSSERNKRSGAIPYYGATGQVGTIDRAIFNEELVVLGEDGVQFFDQNKPKAYKISGPAWVNNHAHVLRPKKDLVLQNFLLHFLNQFNYIGYANGTTRLKLTQGAMNSIPVPLPSVDEQHKILELLEDHLSRLDAALVDVQHAKIKAAQFRRSLLQATFTGNMGSQVAIPFSEWQRKTVGDIADTQLGKMLNKGKQSGRHAMPYLRTDNVHWGRFDLSEIKEMDILPEEHSKYLAIKGDLLMCEGGASGRTAIWNEDYDISFQNHVHRIRPKNLKEILPKYLLYYFEWFIKNGYASDLIKGVTISSLSQSGLRSIEVTYPPIDEQHKIVEILEDHLSRLEASISLADATEKQSKGLRRSLLQAAFTGQLAKEVISV
jgi:type I restriction enzyme S subunit